MDPTPLPSATAKPLPERRRAFFQSLALGLAAGQKVTVFGEIYLGELLAIAYAMSNPAKIVTTRQDRLFVLFAALWCGAQVLSDLVNATPLADAAKGVLAPAVFTLTTLVLINHFRDAPARIPPFILGTSIGGLIHLLILPTPFFDADPWKWGVGDALITFFAIHYSFLTRHRTTRRLVLFVTIFSAASLVLGARSMALFAVAASFTYLTFKDGKPSRFARYLKGRWAGTKLLLLVVPAILLANLLATALFTSASLLSWLPPAITTKYYQQARGEYGLLIGGRTEILISAQAFADKPLLGHGSWARDRGGYVERYFELRQALGYARRGETAELIDQGRIPAHSFIMQALVWSGLAGGVFWVYVLRTGVLSFIQAMHRLPFYFHLGMMSLVWSVLFSPFGAFTRWSTALFLGAYLAYLYSLRQRTSHPQ